MPRFTFLGTSSGVPTRARNVTALAVQIGMGKQWVLVDCGEATQHQLLKVKHTLRDLQTILITHAHGDHFYGLPGLLASAAMQGRTAPLDIVAPEPVLQWLDVTCRIGDLDLPFALQMQDVATASDCVWQRAETNAAHTRQLRITHHGLQHRVPSFAYAFEWQSRTQALDADMLRKWGVPQGPLWKQLQDGHDVEWGGSPISSSSVLQTSRHTLRAVVGGDNAAPALLREACAGAALLIHEATFTRAVLDKVGSGPMHSCAADVAAFAQSVGVPHLILTHFSPRFESAEGIQQLRSEAEEHYRGVLHLAQDLQSYDLTWQGALHLIEAQPNAINFIAA